MGLSSSQARLLSLTGRMHDIEYKAQKLEAQKLQMANESRHVYKQYENALNKTTIQGLTIAADGSGKFINADLFTLEGNGSEPLSKTIYLKNTDNDKIYISRLNANKFQLTDTGIAGTEVEFMNKLGYTTKVLGFDTVSNSAPVNQYTTVDTVKGTQTTREVPNFNPNWGYQPIASTPVSASAVAVSTVTGDFDKNKTYVIKTKADLVALQNLTNSGKNTQGVKFVLGADIDMSGVNWTGIGNTTANSFKGIFDGNGHTISNLTGSSGLFKYVNGDQKSVIDPNNGATTTATYGVVKNVILQNVNITTSATSTGGLIGQNTAGYVYNCFTSGNISAGQWAGGLVGYNLNGAIEQSTSNANINKALNCTGAFIGHDTNGVVQHCISTGKVNATSSVGGFIGHEYANGSGFIYECATISNVTGSSSVGAFIGKIDPGCTATVVGSQYSAASGLNPVGTAQGTITSNGNDSSLTAGSTRTVTTTNITMPSKTSIKSNVMMAIDKSGQTVDAAFEAKLDTWLNQFYKEDTRYSNGVLINDALKLASINDFVTEYLKNGADGNVVNAIMSDVNNDSIAGTAQYQDKYKATKDFEYTPYAANATTQSQKSTIINTGTADNVGNNLYTVLRNSGQNLESTQDVTKVLNWVKSKFNSSTDAGKLALAEFNNYITGNPDAAELNKIMQAINNNTAYNVPAASKVYTDAGTKYVVNQQAKTQNPNIGWDLTDPDVKEALDFYNVVKGGYIIVEDEQASNTDWVVNMVNGGFAIFTQYDEATDSLLDTNVATNTCLQEVSNEIELKKAEAEYEASMRKIDNKDKRYDVELAALENERNAIKTEMDTLKTVAKDNVDRTFKLFG